MSNRSAQDQSIPDKTIRFDLMLPMPNAYAIQVRIQVWRFNQEWIDPEWSDAFAIAEFVNVNLTLWNS